MVIGPNRHLPHGEKNLDPFMDLIRGRLHLRAVATFLLGCGSEDVAQVDSAIHCGGDEFDCNVLPGALDG